MIKIIDSKKYKELLLLQEDVADKENTIEELYKQLDDNKNEIKSFKGQKGGYISHINLLVDEIDQLHSKLDECTDKNKNYQEKIKIMTDKIAKLDNDLSASNTAYELLSKVNEELTNRLENGNEEGIANE